MIFSSWLRRSGWNRVHSRTDLRVCRPRLELLETRDLPSAAAITVHPGDSIQAAVDAARPGGVIFIDPGTYLQTVTVAKPGIHLIGLSGGGGVVIENPGNADNGITVAGKGQGFDLENVTVEGFTDNGVLLTGVQDFRLSHVTAVDNGEYGLFPVLSSDGLIENCTASGHADTGIYVGQSKDVLIRNCTAFDNVIGIEMENSTRVAAVGNESFNNTAGILIDLLPGLDVNFASNNVIMANYVHDNNHVNFAPPGEIESFVPPGIGILILGADRTLVAGNLATGNDQVGIGLASTELLTTLANQPPSILAGIDPNPDGNHIIGNIVLGNGGAPSVPSIPGADLLWDGSGKHNCWSGNIFDTSFPAVLPTCP